jgi:hypothetical protein
VRLICITENNGFKAPSLKDGFILSEILIPNMEESQIQKKGKRRMGDKEMGR